MSTAWESLVRSALLGTDRQPVDPADLPDVVRARTTADGSPTRRLLDAAALLAGYRRAEGAVVSGVEVEPPAPEDDRPLVSAAAARRLGRLLTGENGWLLHEWLDLAVASGRRPPPERLPALAELARTRSALRPPVAAAAGPRGPWLAARAPKWEFLADAPDTVNGSAGDTWRNGGTIARWAWLERARRNDPDLARTALADVWRTEPATARATFLDTLRIGLGPADEEFLESALDDRAQDVRALAAALLVRVPGSRLGLRMAARLAELVTVRRRPARAPELAVELPTECDDAMRRDGVVPTTRHTSGPRAWWFRQLVAATPLSWWATVEPDPARLLRMQVSGPIDTPTLHASLASAAVDQGAAAWADALLAVPAVNLDDDAVAELVAVLPRHRWAEAADTAVDRNRLATLDGVLSALPAPWPVALGDLVLTQLDEQAGNRTLAPIADAAARAVPPECCRDHPITERVGAPDACPWHHRLVETLLFRRAMYEELS